MLMDKTLKSILEDPRISQIAPDAIKRWDLTKEEFYSWTLREIAEKMGWKCLNRGFARLFEAADSGEYYFPLYSDEECAAEPSRKNANFVYFPSKDAEADERPFIFLVPGGGFVNVWNMTEGWPIARIYNELGYHVFILTYQVGVEAAAVKAMADTARAMEMIAARKDEFHVDPARYITCGFSAGGYVVCLWNTEKGYIGYNLPKPLASFPVYPVTSYRLMAADGWADGQEQDDFARSGVGCTMEEACNSCFDIPSYVEGFPPTALFLAAEDDLVDPEHSKRLAEALDKAGIPCYMEIGPTGGHGFADGEGMCMEGWPERAIRWYENLK